MFLRQEILKWNTSLGRICSFRIFLFPRWRTPNALVFIRCHWPLRLTPTFHRNTFLSTETETSFFPSGLKLMPVTAAVCPFNVVASQECRKLSFAFVFLSIFFCVVCFTSSFSSSDFSSSSLFSSSLFFKI